MTAVDWDEVKRLAADFQKAQLSSTLQKLSERNCVEIITKLTTSKLLDIIFTVDGKEYVTPEHLGKEIKDELYVHEGRINLVELAKILNVDLSQISKVASDIERHNKGMKLILGQLIDKSYVLKIVGEINDKLCQNGYINVAELTLQYDLPADFLQSTIEKELGKIIQGKQDKQDLRIFYTEGFIARNRAKIRGALAAITKPTPVMAILGQCKVPERIFFSILESLQEMMQIPGIVTGKQSHNSIYIPTIHTKKQTEWVDSFYKQNGYIEYDALSGLGITDPHNFVNRRFPNETLTQLRSAAVGKAIIDQVDANIEEMIATSSFVDLYPLLPTVFRTEDTEELLLDELKRSPIKFHIFGHTVAMSEAYLQSLIKLLEAIAEKHAKEAVDSGKWLQTVAENKLKMTRTSSSIIDCKADRKEERRKKASSGKAGGGSQGRETKTRSTKKKYNQSKNHDNDSEDENTKNNTKTELVLVTLEEIKNELGKDENLADMGSLIDDLADYLQPRLNKLALSYAEKLAQTTKNNNNLSEIEERLNMLATNIRIFDKAIKLLDKHTQSSLAKYLMKTLAVDFATDIFKLAAQQNLLQCPSNITTEARIKMLTEFPNDVKEALGNLHRTIVANSTEEFLNSIEPAMAACCLVLKKFDKKKERPVVLGHRQALLEQLRETSDPALALHLVTSVLFTASTQSALHMSGRHVSSVLSFLRSHLETTTVSELSQYHDRVLEFLSSTDEESKEETRKILENDLAKIKDIAKNFKNHLKSDKIHE
ncbi:E3 UFM1-protein ligase 1 homolog [Venturia canescens]|uniref:E3 UFM1-protein ligase 1 homolog n=1 Tax=Venturia canescens TaxID=32260 RepID=UPI001C9D3345|nr:E3 UFM1-protein ligase 1 homolog [Venturia canescens]